MSGESRDDVNQTVALGDHGEWLGELERLFLGKLSAERSAVVYAHVKSCGTCERAWSRLADAEKALFPARSDRALTPFAADRVKARLFSGARTEAEQPAPARARWIPWASLAGVAASVLLAAVIVRAPTNPVNGGHRSDEFLARGGDAKLTATLGVRALAVRERPEGGFDVEDLANAGALSVGDHVKLLATSIDAARWVSASIFDGSGREVAHVEPQQLSAGAADASLGRAIPVTSEWPVGQVKIVASFSTDAPSDARDLAKLSASDGAGRWVRVLEAKVVERTITGAPKMGEGPGK